MPASRSWGAVMRNWLARGMVCRKSLQIDTVIGSNLQRICRERGLAKDDLSHSLKTNQRRIERFERGAERIPSAILFKLGRLLNVPVGAFFETDPVSGGSDEMVS